MSEVVLNSRKGTRLYFNIVEGSSKPVVVFIHNMYGSYRSFHRHVKMFNEMGYTTASFDLVHASSNKEASKPQLVTSPLAFIYVKWTEQITDVLDSIPGQKIVFSFSGPSISALISASSRTDIDKFICDGGPFRELWDCIYRMFTVERQIANPIKHRLWTMGACLLLGPFAFRHLTQALEKWNPKLPILSIRGAQDPIVFPQNINNVFENQNHINIRIFLIEKGQHLDGLKNFPKEYRAVLLSFLNGEMGIHYA